MAGLLTKGETNIVHAVRTNKPAHATWGVVRSSIRAHVAEVVTVQLREVIRIRVIHPHTDLLVLRTVRVRIKLDYLALGIVEGLHVNGVATILTSYTGIHRRHNAALLSPLCVDADTPHRDRLPRITRTRVDRKVTITLVNDVTFDRLVGAFRSVRLDSTFLGCTRGKGVALLIDHRLVDTLGILTRVLDTITRIIRLASLIRSTSVRSSRKLRRCNRLRKRRNQRKRQRGRGYGCTTATCDVLSLHVFPLQGSIVPRSPTPTFRRRAEQST